jgi:phospholipase D1/2
MTKAHRSHSILEAGRNCWRLERAQRAALLVDGAAYFGAVRTAAARARRSVLILGWDIDSRMRLVPECAGDGLPETLGDFLNALVKRSRELEIYVLDWDFAMIYAADRELLPVYKPAWRANRRLHFHLDAAHPMGASHHQKIVVVDDAVAFVGGLDLTHCRWDTPEHRPDDPRRRHPDGGSCPPFHDMQMAVDGAAAAALGELARERWRRATGASLTPTESNRGNDPWPPLLEPDLTDIRVAVARTEPAYEDYPEIQEIKSLYLDAIAAARHSLYLENQYFTAGQIAEALARRLREATGPEVVLISRRKDSGWLEESTMGVLRARLHRRLRDTDPHGRYGCFYPHVPGLEEGFLNVHAKLLIMDDDLVMIGSANLNNRSMGFDTECNLAVEAGGEERIRRAIRGLRQRLLAEHLGVSVETIAEQEKETGRLLATIDALRGARRTLMSLEPEELEEEEWVPAGAIIDPEKPVAPERLVAELAPQEDTAPAAGRLIASGALLAVFLGLAAAWRWTPLGRWLELDTLAGAAETLKQAPAAPLAVLGAWVIAGLLVVPVTLLVAVTALVFGSWLGLAYALGGSLLSAAATYGLGRMLGRNAVRRMAGSGLNRLSRRLGQRGLLTVIAVRLIPVAPFTVVNMVAGASHVRWRDFLLGTLVGMAPGIIATALFVDRIVAAIREPGTGTLTILAAVLLFIMAAAAALRNWLRRHGAGNGRD